MTSSTQHGRQTAHPTDPRTDPRTRNVPAPSAPATSTGDAQEVCRDFIWGICTNSLCKHRHEFQLDAMKAVLKFCHDHQNRTGCTRPGCTYLHTSREEENLFLNAGVIPRVLAERYTAVLNTSAPAAGNENTQNLQPLNNMIYEYIAQPPPPPPPAPALVSTSLPHPHSPMQPTNMPVQGNPTQGLMQNSMQAPMPNPMHGPIQNPLQNHMQGPMPSPIQGHLQGPVQNHMHGPMPGHMQGPMQGPIQGHMQGPMQGPMPGPMLGTMQVPMAGHMQGPMQGLMQGPLPGSMPVPALMPPPPPPPPSSLRMSGSLYLQSQPSASQNMVYHPTFGQQAPIPPPFDPTRPPPTIISNNIQQVSPSRAGKRPAAEESEAGPSKLLRTDSSNDSSCENCVDRLLRSELYAPQIELQQEENEEIRTDHNIRLEDYERKKQVLKSILSPEFYRRADEYIENGSPSPFSTLRNEMHNTASSLFPSQVAASVNTNNNSMIHQLVDILMGNNTREPLGTVPSNSGDQLSTLFSLFDSFPSASDRLAAGSSGEADLVRPSSSGLANSSNGFNRFLSESSSPPRQGDGRLARGRPYGDNLAGAGPPRPYGDAAGAGPSLNANPRPFPESVQSIPASNRPYLETAQGPGNPHSYGDNAMGAAISIPYDGLGRPYAENAPGPSRYPPRQYHPGLPDAASGPSGGAPAAGPSQFMPGNYAPPPQPPAVAFYGHYPNNMPNPPYPGVGMNQAPRPSMPPQNAQNNTYFMGGRYPNQHNYPPYQ